eukprot:6022-Eustigmatos_ZCMA.PRE.1
MLASGLSVSLPSSARSSDWRCSSLRYSGKAASTRPATEMSRVSTWIPAGAAKVRMMGRKALVASRGASSVRV